MLTHQLGRSLGRWTNRLRMNAAAEPDAGLTGEIEGLPRVSHADEIEIGRFEENVRGAGGDLRFGSAHNSGDSDRPDSVSYHHVLGRKLPQLPIEGRDFFAGSRRPHDDSGLAARTLR